MAEKLQIIGETEPGMADYIWSGPDGKLRSKTRVITCHKKDDLLEPMLERWTTSLDNVQIVLVPVHWLFDPMRDGHSFIILCEVRDSLDTPLPYDHRARLRNVNPNPGFWWGVRQQYRFSDLRSPSANQAAERHLSACFESGLMIHSARWGQGNWEFKIGPRRLPDGFDAEPPTALLIGDHLQIARHFLFRVAREQGLEVSYDDLKCSVFFSTTETRKAKVDIQAVATELQLRLGLSQLDVVKRLGLVERGYTALEIRGFEATCDPYLLLGKVIGPVYNGKQGNSTPQPISEVSVGLRLVKDTDNPQDNPPTTTPLN